MKKVIKQWVAVIFTVIMLFTSFSNGIGPKKVYAAGSITYIAHQYVTTKNTDYGYIMEPDKPGTYPVVIIHHGQSSYNYVREYIQTNITDWVNKGLLEPMIVITPCVQEATYIGNDTYVQQKTPGLLQKIKDGTFQNMLEYATIDTTKKPALCGYSLGGAMTAYAGMKYKDSFSYLGIISPGIQALYPGSDGNPQNWILMDEDTKNYQLTTDPDHLFMIFSGRGSSDIIYDDVANVHMTEYGRAAGFTHVTWKVGEHKAQGGFDWSLLYFLYTLQHGKQPSGEPSDEVLKKAFGNDKNFSRTVYHPGDPDNRETITGPITGFGDEPLECGYKLYASIPKSNANKTASGGTTGRTSFSYRWYRDGQRVEYFYEEGTGNKRSNTVREYKLTEEDIGHKITVEAYNSVGVRKGVLTFTTSDVIKKKSSVAAPKNLTTTPATGSQKNGSIGNVTTAMEYASKTDKFTTWKSCTGSSVTGLAAGEYRVRYKETGAALASQAATVTIGSNGDGNVTPETLTGTVKISGTARCLYKLTADASGVNISNPKYQWMRVNTAISGANSTEYTLQKEDIGQQISCVVTDKDGKKNGKVSSSKTEVVKKAYGPDVPQNLVAVDCTKGLKNGKILNVTSDMEYAKDNQNGPYTDCSGTEITGLEAGTYIVRVKETDTTYHGGMAVVTVGEKEMSTSDVPVIESAVPSVSNNTVDIGQNYSITVNATGSNLTYQWMWRTDDLGWATSKCPGNDTATITLEGKRPVVYYKCVISNEAGSVETNEIPIYLATPGLTSSVGDTVARGQAYTISSNVKDSRFTYSWEYNKHDDKGWLPSQVADCNKDTLHLEGKNPVITYRCTIAYQDGNNTFTITSDEITITMPE